MGNHNALERILAALHDAMLDDTQWPATSALIDEACGTVGNVLLVTDGPKDDIRVTFAGLYYRGGAGMIGRVSTRNATTLSMNGYRVCGNCPTARTVGRISVA